MLTRKGFTLEQLSANTRQLYDVLNNESDLACVVIGAAFLDNVLASLVGAKLLDSSVTKRLLDSNGVLGSFTSRADLAYCLGLIEKEGYNDLRIIAKIRNLFAHSHLHLSFNELKVHDLCNQLRQWRVLEAEKEEFPTNPTAEQLRMIARNQFNFSVVLLANRLVLTGFSLKKNEQKAH